MPRTFQIGSRIINTDLITNVDLEAEQYDYQTEEWLPAVTIYFAAPQGDFDGVNVTTGSIQPDSITFTTHLDKIREFLTAVLSPIATLDLAEKK